MTNEQLLTNIEALLLSLGGPISYTQLAKMLGVAEDDISAAAVSTNRSGGIVLVDDGKSLELRAAASASEVVEKAHKEEFAREIGRAGLEVVAAVMYRGPLSRSEIDFIRGVNSSQTLRTLTMRGLIRKVPNPKDERSFLYEPTTELLSQLGVVSKQELPEYERVRSQLNELESAYRAREETI